MTKAVANMIMSAVRAIQFNRASMTQKALLKLHGGASSAKKKALKALGMKDSAKTGPKDFARTKKTASEYVKEDNRPLNRMKD